MDKIRSEKMMIKENDNNTAKEPGKHCSSGRRKLNRPSQTHAHRWSGNGGAISKFAEDFENRLKTNSLIETKLSSAASCVKLSQVCNYPASNSDNSNNIHCSKCVKNLNLKGWRTTPRENSSPSLNQWRRSPNWALGRRCSPRGVLLHHENAPQQLELDS